MIIPQKNADDPVVEFTWNSEDPAERARFFWHLKLEWYLIFEKSSEDVGTCKSCKVSRVFNINHHEITIKYY